MIQNSLRPVFKISAGQASRDFSDVFMENDFAAIGPGRLGDWRDYERKWEVPVSDRTPLNAMLQMAEGDLVVLTSGFRILTVGRLTNTYSFNGRGKLFGSWDLFNTVRIKWARPDDPAVDKALGVPEERPAVKVRGRLRQLGPGSEPARRWAREVDKCLDELGYWNREIQPERLVLDDDNVALDQLPGFLDLSVGARGRIREVTKTAELLREAMEDRGSPTSEHETVALIVVPFFQALGWGSTNIALEWNRIDVALFSSTEREKPVAVVEAKRPGSGLDWARGQAGRYAETHGLDCPLITTDGFYWALFENAVGRKPIGEAVLPEIHKSASDFFVGLLRLGLVPDR